MGFGVRTLQASQVLPHQTGKTISLCMRALCAGEWPCWNRRGHWWHKVRNTLFYNKSLYVLGLRDCNWNQGTQRQKYTKSVRTGETQLLLTSRCCNTKEETYILGIKTSNPRSWPLMWLQAAQLDRLSNHTVVSHDPAAFHRTDRVNDERAKLPLPLFFCGYLVRHQPRANIHAVSRRLLSMLAFFRMSITPSQSR